MLCHLSLDPLQMLHLTFSLATSFKGFRRASKKRRARVSVMKPMQIFWMVMQTNQVINMTGNCKTSVMNGAASCK